MLQGGGSLKGAQDEILSFVSETLASTGHGNGGTITSGVD